MNDRVETLHDGRAIRRRWLAAFWAGIFLIGLASVPMPPNMFVLPWFAGLCIAIGAGLKPLFAAGLDSRVLADTTLRLHADNRELQVDDELFSLEDVRHLLVTTYRVKTQYGSHPHYGLYLVLRTVVVEVGHFSSWRLGTMQSVASSLASRLGVPIHEREFNFREKYISEVGIVIAMLSLMAILPAGGFLVPESLLGVWSALAVVVFGWGYLQLQARRVRKIADRIAIEEFRLASDDS